MSDIIPCGLWEIALNCELSNWMTMILELSIAGAVAIILSIFFYRKQATLQERFFALENTPEIKIEHFRFIFSKNEPTGKLRFEITNTGLSDAIKFYYMFYFNSPGELSLDNNSTERTNYTTNIKKLKRNEKQEFEVHLSINDCEWMKSNKVIKLTMHYGYKTAGMLEYEKKLERNLNLDNFIE